MKQQNQTGTVYLVGAGPSDAGLLTVKGQQLLKQAQVVIYDALVGAGILGMISEQAETICVGKRSGCHSMKQEEINRLLVQKAKQGRMVVRLKGGDPFLFGRGSEEAEQLLANKIPFEIVPGVTSAIAVPAYSGIPVTHRDLSSSVHIITGHKKQDAPLDLDFEALLRAGGTDVFLMGVNVLPEIVNGFLDAGMAPDTPAAVLSQGTGFMQRTVTAQLSMLVEEAGRHSVKTPAVIVIGQTAALAAQFAWYEKLPLFGRRILVTRPSSRNDSLVSRLRGLGAEVIEAASIRTVPRACGQEFLEVLAKIGSYDYLVFTSPAGVAYFMSLLNQYDRDIRCIGDIRLAAVGSATRDALLSHGLRVSLMPQRYNGIELGRCLRKAVRPGGKVLLLRSALGSKQLIKEIKADHQIEVTDLAIYDTINRTNSALDLRALVEESAGDGSRGPSVLVLFTSSSTVRGFVQAAQGLACGKVHAVCIGQATADTAAGYGMQVTMAAKETVTDMVDAVLALCKK